MTEVSGGSENTSRGPFCPHCGSEFDTARPTCLKCGATLDHLVPHDSDRSDDDQFRKLEFTRENDAAISSELPVARPMKRLLAATIDLGVAFALMSLTARLFLKSTFLTNWLFILVILPAVYLVLRDSLGGKSVGKFALGLTTYNLKRNRPADFADSVIRNWFLFVIILPPSLPGIFFMIRVGSLIFAVIGLIILIQIVSGARRRLGETFAGTIVVEDAVTPSA